MTIGKKLLHALIWAKRLMYRKAPPEISHIAPFISETDVCFDVGAHGGAWTLPLSRAVRQGQVYAFEALPYYADVLKILCKLRMSSNVQVVNKAVGDKPRSVNIVSKNQAGERLTGKIHVQADGEEAQDTAQVEGITLDSFLGKLDEKILKGSRIRFVKADIEGFELPMLKGATRLIDQHRPLFFLELWKEYTERYDYLPEDLFKFLEERSYSMFISTDQGFKTVLANEYPGRGDVLAIPKEDVAAQQICN